VVQERQASSRYFLFLRTSLEKQLMEMWSSVSGGDGLGRGSITVDWNPTSLSLSITPESECILPGMLGRQLIESLTFTVCFRSPQKNIPALRDSINLLRRSLFTEDLD